MCSETDVAACETDSHQNKVIKLQCHRSVAFFKQITEE